MDELQELMKVSVAGFTLEKLLSAVVLAVVCLAVIKLLLGLSDRAMKNVKMDASLKRFIRTGIKVLLLCVAVIMVMGCLDIPVTSLVAVLSVVGLALSLAVQNFLANVAGGLQILASSPFKIGDFVEAGGCSGTVTEIGLFYTKLITPDNKLVQLPNSTIVAANITNYSSEKNRRVDLKISASYDAPCEQVKQVLTQVVKDHPLTLSDPEPMIRVNSYGDNAIEYVVRAWCAGGDYWTVYFDLLEAVKPAFDRAGIEMTYPHINVHMVGKKEQ
jgi:small conductance mechanosensitive channel